VTGQRSNQLNYVPSSFLPGALSYREASIGCCDCSSKLLLSKPISQSAAKHLSMPCVIVPDRRANLSVFGPLVFRLITI
jgi:hypothetical protein